MFPRATIQPLPDEETKTTCPACAGCGKVNLAKVAPSTYRFILCSLCDGHGRVSASRASGFRRRQVLK